MTDYKVGISVTADTAGAKLVAAGLDDASRAAERLKSKIGDIPPVKPIPPIAPPLEEAEKAAKKAADAFAKAQVELQREAVLLRDGADAAYRFDRSLENLTDEQMDHLDAMRKANAELRNGSDEMANTAAAAKTMAGVVVAAVTATVAVVVDLTGDLLAFQGELSASATAVGVTTQSMQVWRAEAKKVGVDAEKLTDIFKDFNDKRGDLFRNDAGELKDGFKALNLDIKEFIDLAPDEAMLRLGDAMRESGLTLAEKTFLLEAIDDASRLIPLLENTSAKIRDIQAASATSSTVLMDSQIESLKEVNIQLDAVKAEWDGVKVQIGMIGTEIARNLTDEINIAARALNGFAMGLRDLSGSMKSVVESPPDLLAAIGDGKTDDAIAQINAYTTEFKTASQERRAVIRQELLDFYDALKAKQAHHAEAINSASQHQGGMMGGLAGLAIEADALKLAELAKVSAAVQSAFSATQSILNPAYWDKLTASQKPFWETIKQGTYGASFNFKATADTVTGDWLPAVEKYKTLVSESANQFAVDAKLVQAVMMRESIVAARKRGVSPETIGSPAGAQGLMQLMPGTAAGMAKELNMTGYSLYSAADNIKLGTAYLSKMLYEQGGDITRALAAYNAGPGAVKKYGGVPPYQETQTYVQKVMGYYKQLTGEKAREDKQAADNHVKAEREAQQNISQIMREAGVARRKVIEQNAAVDTQAAQAKAAQALTAIDAEEAVLRERLTRGEISNQQVLQQERQFELRRQQIKVQALMAQKAILARDPEKNVVAAAQLNLQLQQLEQQHQIRLAQIKQRAYIQSKQLQANFITQSMQGVQQSLAGILSFSTSIADGVRGMFQAVLNTAASMLAELAARWLTNQLMTLVYGKTTALSQIGANAAAAGSGAYAATAMIPVVGPAMAPAAAATAYAGAMSFAGTIPAAAKGFDIPAGMNPLTQLHEKEMVLPAHLADNVRNMTGRGGDSININVSAMDSRDVRRLLQNEGGSLTAALKREYRNFRGF